jgi:hypothetical protein
VPTTGATTSRRPQRRWTPDEIEFVWRHRTHFTLRRMIALVLDRSTEAIDRAIQQRRLNAKRRVWTEGECAIVRELFRKVPGPAIARRLRRSTTEVYQKARLLGLSIPQRFTAPDMVEFIKARNAEGWPDSEIARARGVDRHAVACVRKQLGLPSNALSERRRDAVRQKTAEQLQRMGLTPGGLASLCYAAHRKFARDSGWPEDLLIRETQILNAMWDRGPMTRREIAQAIGMRTDKHSYLATLMKRGMVICMPRKVQTGRRGGNVNLYMLSLTIRRTRIPQPGELHDPFRRKHRLANLHRETVETSIQRKQVNSNGITTTNINHKAQLRTRGSDHSNPAGVDGQDPRSGDRCDQVRRPPRDLRKAG